MVWTSGYDYDTRRKVYELTGQNSNNKLDRTMVVFFLGPLLSHYTPLCSLSWPALHSGASVIQLFMSVIYEFLY
jgi:hypothetical protein